MNKFVYPELWLLLFDLLLYASNTRLRELFVNYSYSRLIQKDQVLLSDRATGFDNAPALPVLKFVGLTK